MNWTVAISIGLIGTAIVMAALYGDDLRLRRAAIRIDANFQKLKRPPSWQELGSIDAFSSALQESILKFEDACGRELGFASLGRLRELGADGELLGVRTVMMSPDHKISAVFAGSHLKESLKFRMIGVRTREEFIYAIDRRIGFTNPVNIRATAVSADFSEQQMLSALNQLLELQTSPIIECRDMAAYVDWQRAAWDAKNQERSTAGFVIDWASIRRLSPAHMSDRRLKRLHAKILKLHGVRR